MVNVGYMPPLLNCHRYMVSSEEIDTSSSVMLAVVWLELEH
jgi:hypothetical protein